MHVEARIYPDKTEIRLRQLIGQNTTERVFLLEHCIGVGGSCTAYQAVSEDGIPVKLKHFCPPGLRPGNSLYEAAQARFKLAYQQQISMMRNETISAVTAGLFGMYKDAQGGCWTSVNATVGKTLDCVLAETSLADNLKTLLDIAESVKAYHEAGWLLLDVKPSNILVINSPGVRGVNFFDFDSFVQVSALRQAAEERRGILLSSTEGYSAPELLEAFPNPDEIGPAADFYSIGAILFEALFGRCPTLLDCLPDAVYGVSSLRDERDRPPTATLSESLEQFLRRTLTLSPGERFASDDDLLAALRELSSLADATISRRRFQRVVLLLAASLLCVFLLAVLAFRVEDNSPLLRLTLMPTAEGQTLGESPDTELILQRLHQLGFRNVERNGPGSPVLASGRASLLGGASELIKAIRLLITRPDRLYVFGIQGNQIVKAAIPRDQVLSASAEFGYVPGLDRSSRSLANLPDTQKLSYLRLHFSEDAAQTIRDIADRSERISFGFDFELPPPVYNAEQIRLALSLPASSDNSWLVLDGRWTGRTVCSALAAILMQGELSENWACSINVDPAADWEDPGRLAGDCLGQNQRGIEELEGDTATMYYRTWSPELISDSVYAEILQSFRNRLDAFGCPYAIGNGFFHAREIAVCMPAERLNRDIAVDLIPQSGVLVLDGQDEIVSAKDAKALRAEVVRGEDGRFGLLVTAPDSAYITWLLRDAGASSGKRPVLCLGSRFNPILEAGDASPADGILFDRLLLSGLERVDEDKAFLLDVIAAIVNGGGVLSPNMPADYSGWISLNTDYSFLSEGACFGIPSAA